MLIDAVKSVMFTIVELRNVSIWKEDNLIIRSGVNILALCQASPIVYPCLLPENSGRD